MIRVLMIGIFLVGVSTALAAEGPGLKKGTKAPEIELKDQNGKVVKVSDMLKKGPVAVVFHRSANW
jgi:hypothetical protein